MIPNLWKKKYRDLAEKLDIFYTSTKDNNKSTGEQFYDLCTNEENKKEFNSLFGWSKNITQKSIDPIHIFSSFNNSGISMENKEKRFFFYYKILEASGSISSLNENNFLPDNRFSVPHIAIIYVVADRKVHQQRDIWDLFHYIMKEEKKEIRNRFDKYKGWFGIGFTVLTEFLFWIDSDNYISLDKNTKQLLKKYHYNIPTNYETYNSCIKDIKSKAKNINIFRLLVEFAYIKKEPENIVEQTAINNVLLPINRKQVLSYTEKETMPEEDIQFQLIAIQPLQNCEDKYLKKLHKNELYRFSNKFIIEDDSITYDETKECDLFNIDNLKLNINIIVGKNGSGKSTIVELAFMIINNLACFLFENGKSNTPNYNIKYIEDKLHAKLYFLTEHLYEVEVENDSITIQQYIQTSKLDTKINFTKNKDYDQNLFNFSSLYYTEHVNYSLHSLNANYYGLWINELFHKNDGYSTPIVIEPRRKKGVIDINTLNMLVKDRIMSILLLSESENNLKLGEKFEVIGLKLNINYQKLIDRNLFPETEILQRFLNGFDFKFDLIEYQNFYINYRNLMEDSKSNKKDSLNKLIKKGLEKLSIKEIVLLYIYQKISIIVWRHDCYDNELKEFELKNYQFVINKLIQDTSHITYKLKRAINFLVYYDKFFYKLQYLNVVYPIADIRSLLINIQASAIGKIDELSIPSIFDVDIIFKDGNTFESLSSGERQIIFSLAGILYHLKNISSIDDGYKYVNVVLDESELYFHPEMQKDLINDLYTSIKSDDYIRSNLNSINFIFVTHSPFILSDIIHHNIMALTEDGHQFNKIEPCFGGNIYNLLHNSFFMNEFIGKFSKQRILDILNIINLYHKKSLKKEDHFLLESYNNRYRKTLTIDQFQYKRGEIQEQVKSDKNNMEKLVKNIGEKILKEELLNKLKTVKDIDINNELDKYSIHELEEYLKKRDKHDIS